MVGRSRYFAGLLVSGVVLLLGIGAAWVVSVIPATRGEPGQVKEPMPPNAIPPLAELPWRPTPPPVSRPAPKPTTRPRPLVAPTTARAGVRR